jgi:hypothetical protein
VGETKVVVLGFVVGVWRGGREFHPLKEWQILKTWIKGLCVVLGAVEEYDTFLQRRNRGVI